MSTKGTRAVRPVLEELLGGPFTFAIFMGGIRATLDLTQAEMAKKLGISRQALCEIEKGRTIVSAETAVSYARKAGFSEVVAAEAALQDQLRKSGLKKKRVQIVDVA